MNPGNQEFSRLLEGQRCTLEKTAGRKEKVHAAYSVNDLQPGNVTHRVPNPFSSAFQGSSVPKRLKVPVRRDG